MNSIEKQLTQHLKQSPDLDFQGFHLQASLAGKKIVDISHGKTYPIYDIASLTKIVFTTTWFVQAVSEKKIKLSDPVARFLPWYRHGKIQVGQLLNHSAGNKWWQPFYKYISPEVTPEQRFQQLEKLCQKAPLSRGGKATYSDIDFYLLGAVMQEIEGQPLRNIWQHHKELYYPSSQFHFNFNNRRTFAKSKYAPTETCSWRKKTMQGEVHDENAWALGGVAPHAGLFGSIDDLYEFGAKLRQSYRGDSSTPFSHATMKKFATRSLPKAKGDWGYGFMLPSGPQSTAGRHFSARSFGHTGFTGTSFWFDPKRDLYVCLLSNRVYPSREQKGFVRLRPQLHNWIVEAIEEEK